MTLSVTLSVLAVLLTFAAINTRYGALAGMLLAGALLGMSIAVIDGRSRPKPTAWEHRWGTDKIELLWWRLEEGKAIYAVALLPGEPEPRYYVLPWSRRTAEALEKMRERMDKGHRVVIPYPFAPSLERRKPLVPHDLPPPAFPPKAGQDKPAPPKFEM